MVKRIWTNIVYYLISIFLMLTIWATTNLYIKQIVAKYSLEISGIISGILLAVCFVFKNKRNWSLKNCIDKISPVWLFIVIPMALKLIIIFIWNMPIAGDIGVYIQCAKELEEAGILSTYTDYSLRFPHLFWTGVVLMPLCRLGTSYKIFQSAFAIMGTISGWILYKALCSIWNERKARTILFIYSYMPSALFACMATTHEMIFQFMLACAIGVAAIYKACQKAFSRVVCFALFCIIVGTASLINQMAVVLVITCVLIDVLYERKACKIKFMHVAGIIGVLLITAQIAPVFQKMYTESEHNVAQKAYAWSIYVGANYETEGRYNEEDKQVISDYIYNKTGQTTYDTREYEETAWILAQSRWKELFFHPDKLVRHLLHKFMIVWSGTHFAIEYTNTFQIGTKHFILLGIMAINNLIYLFMNLATWIKFQVMGKRRLNESPLFCGCCIFLLGCVCVLLLAEVMNKYNLTALIPLYMIWGNCICEEE